MPVAAKKATIYTEADDEITAVIDKVLSAGESIVAIVLPKRAAVFQSTVNMKLLKKSAENAKKKVVLISSDPAIETIAASAGVHIAQTLSSKPYVPKKVLPAAQATISSEEIDEITEPDSSVVDSPEESAANEADEVIELDNTEERAAESAEEAPLAAGKELKKRRGFKIPDFSSFKLRMVLFIGLIVALIIGWVLGFVVMPRATITIAANTSRLKVDGEFTADATADELNVEEGIIPAEKVKITKKDEARVEATGEKNIGEKATGTVTMTAKNCMSLDVPDPVPAGSGVSTGEKTYITQKTVTFTGGTFDGTCLNFNGGDTAIVAQNSGSDYNTDDGTSFEVSGRPDVSATGGASGGTTEMVKIVSDNDIKKARDQLSGSVSTKAMTELRDALKAKQLQPLEETLVVSDTTIESSKPAGAEADSVTVTQSTAFSMLGVKTDDIAAVLDALIADTLQKNQEDKGVRDSGLKEATYQLSSKKSSSVQTLRIETVAVLGSNLNEAELAAEVAGKKRGEIEALVGSKEGVQSVNVTYSPMWVTTTPKSASKIKIVINEVEN